MSARARVVITGLGAVSALGCGRGATAEAVLAGEPRWSEVDRSAGYHRCGGARLAGLVDPAALGAYLSPAVARRMSPPSKLAVAAAHLALEDAGLEADEAAAAQTGVVAATSYGPSSYTEEILSQVLREGPLATSPALFTESVANAPAAQVAIQCRARGPNVTLTQREAGVVLALAEGARALRWGRAERVLVGGVDEMTPVLHAVLDRMGALVTGRTPGGEVARPFDRRRAGFVAAEGAAFVVLETEAEARRRGAPVLAWVGACGAAFDPAAPRTGWSRDPRPLAGALERWLRRAGLEPADFDTVVSGAAGRRIGDRLEALLLRRLWAEAPLPCVLAPKALFGEQLGGFLAAAVLAAAGAPFGPTPGFSEADPELGVVPHDGRPLPPPKRVLVSALAAGGAAAWAVLEGGDA